MVFPALSYRPSFNFELHVGAEAKVIETRGGDSLVELGQVYGSGKFGEVGLRAGFAYDSRGRSISMTTARGLAPPDASAAVAPPRTSGVRVLADGVFVPEGWDVEEKFGGVEGSVAG